MTLDHARFAIDAATFDHVGIQRALHEELGIRDATRVFLEDPHEELTDCLALGLRLGHTPKHIDEAATGIDVDEFDPHVALEGLDDLLTFVLAHETRVDIHTGQLRTDCLVHESSRNCRVDATRETTNHSLCADLSTNRCNLVLDDRAHRPRTRCANTLMDEAFEKILTTFAVHDLRVVLHSPNLSCVVFDHRHWRIRRARRCDESRWEHTDGIEVAHPHRRVLTE